ncbi:putative inosine triphosphate pyrophosphatase [Nadsonia fulvescens var. elongata DSM 6958]|uniref:Inosine triphosphate pyrophosphatase n=1 Tax=Nadsonia fulvescens var. elongata DSM 6958 TaxID=857566 RepID=A0A1E3PP85_9ASCO|nr:putative inosine triphosphate pyrophosphatase [Nadsonia fulvescens var. elongata DSM 6958]
MMSAPITFVTGNANKLKEVNAILGEGTFINHKLDLDELQGSIEEIAIHKAKSAAAIIGGPVVVEDTALGFAAMGGLPGPYIKWYYETIGNENLPRLLAGFEDKTATATCTFAYCSGPGEQVQLFQGKIDGDIVQARGPPINGWNPVFQPKGYDSTFAEMDCAVKNSISHRYLALQKLKAFLKK